MKRFSSDEILNLPTILDVLDDIAKEENNKIPSLNVSFPDRRLWEEGYFSAIRKGNIEERKAMLMPTSQAGMRFYRGQNKEYIPCLPSIFRSEYNDKYDEVVARVKAMEFVLLVSSHPAVMTFQRNGFVIDFEALCQHYGFATQMIDFTNNKWVAAFMATTQWNDRMGKYTPIGAEYGDGYGVLYLSKQSATNLMEKEKLFTVGFQFFKRPSLQYSFGLHIDKGENFTDFEDFEVRYFRHDLKASEYVYAMSYDQKRFFPQDYIADIASDIRESNNISRKAIDCVIKKYYPDQPYEYLEEACKKKNLTIVDDPIFQFDQETIRQECIYWNENSYIRLNERILRVYPVTMVNLGGTTQ